MRIEGTKARRAAEGKRHLAALRGIASLGFSPSKYRAVRLGEQPLPRPGPVADVPRRGDAMP
jgi:hypothetical protein